MLGRTGEGTIDLVVVSSAHFADGMDNESTVICFQSHVEREEECDRDRIWTC